MKEHENNPSSSATVCSCLSAIQNYCLTNANINLNKSPNTIDLLRHDSEIGRLTYTISILAMFAGIIVLLMVRSIRRSKTTIEVEALLDAMRFREELDLQQRQKRRLQKAKNKVTAWLTKTNNKLWSSSPQIILPSNRQNSVQSTSSFIPEIVISNTDENLPKRMNSYTPSLSLIYDFDSSRKNSTFSDISGSSDLFQLSDNYDDEIVYQAARQRSASRADTGESASSAPPAALAAYKNVKEKNKLPIRHSSTSSLSPGRYHSIQRDVKLDME